MNKPRYAIPSQARSHERLRSPRASLHGLLVLLARPGGHGAAVSHAASVAGSAATAAGASASTSAAPAPVPLRASAPGQSAVSTLARLLARGSQAARGSHSRVERKGAAAEPVRAESMARKTLVPHTPRRMNHGPARRGFSVVELLLAVTITTIIVAALYAVFDHTQKALRGTISQVDVLEAGRAAIDLITRDIQQGVPSAIEGNIWPHLIAQTDYPNSTYREPLVQALPNGARTNFLQEYFSLVRPSNYWGAVAFFVASPTNPAVRVRGEAFGALYRYSTTLHPPSRVLHTNAHLQMINHFNYSRNTVTTNVARLVNGVVHFRFRAFDARGIELYSLVPCTVRDWPCVFFQAYGMPAALELELGVLEPQVVEQLKAIADPERARAFLERQAGRVHLFRTRIPLPTGLQ